MTMRDLSSVLRISPVIPVIVIDDLNDAIPLAGALCEGGLSVLEVTLRTSAGLDAITAIRQALPEAVVGAGTVVSAADVQRAKDAGAEFLVSPGCTPGLLAASREAQLPFLPGVNSPSEAMLLLEQGLEYLKFFPAEAAGGIPMLKSLYGPLPQLTFCPTGGVGPDNAKRYLDLPNVVCVGGTWMLDQTAIRDKDWVKIAALAKDAFAIR